MTNKDIAYIYDSRDQLVQATRGPPGSETLLGRYDYNADGLRVRHRFSDRGDVDYFYDETAVIEEHNASDGSLMAHYRYADRLIILDTGAGIQYYHHDALGSTVNLTTESGAVQVSYKLDPWGHIRSQTGSSVNRQIFTGQEHDLNTSLIYFGARYYDPDMARFITQDTYLGEPGTPPSLHRYLYAYSNPTVYVDLYGYASIVKDKEGKKVYWGVLRSKGDLLPHYKWHEIGTVEEKDGEEYVHLTKEYGDGTVKLARLNIAARYFEEDSDYSESDLYYFEEERREFIISAYIDFKVNPHNKAWISATPKKSFFDEYINPLDDLHQDLLLINAGVMRPDDFAGKYAFETLVGILANKVGAEFVKGLKKPLLRILEKRLGRKIDDVIEKGAERASNSGIKPYGEQPKPRAAGEQAHHIVQDARAEGLTGYHRDNAPTEIFVGNTRRGTQHGEASAVQRRINRILRSKGKTTMTYRRARSAIKAEYKAAGKTTAEIQEALDAADSYFIDELGITMDTLLKVPER